MSVRSAGSINENCGGSVVKSGYLKKLKTYKKKFFVLRAETAESSARLEYYDSERKFNNGHPPKRSIPIKTCFNINRRVDTKYKHVIALYTKDDCFCVVLESEEDLDSWLKALLSLQHGEEVIDGEMPKPMFVSDWREELGIRRFYRFWGPHFRAPNIYGFPGPKYPSPRLYLVQDQEIQHYLKKHVWQVKVLNRGLGGNYFMLDDAPVYLLCLTDKTLSLIRKDQEIAHTELCLSSIRSCGNLKNYFYLEMGRSSSIGAGELWMETEDANIAQNIHHTVYHSMTTSSNSKEELGPKSRNRSSSATESSKSITRRQTTPGSVKHHNIPNSNAGGIRERCDSMPSRPRTSSEGNHQVYPWPQQRPYHGSHRPQSFYGRDISYSPPAGSPLSPPSGACSTDSAGSSLSIDDTEHFPETDGICSRYCHSVTPDEAIAEEDCVECSYGMQRSSPSGYVPMAPISSDDGYVDMSPKGRNNRTSPSESMSSITSGTPSTDMRFVEYPLEKVSAYFTPSEEETSSVDRPVRTYSVGSRLEVRKKTAGEIGSLPDSRVRAFSVGSKSKKTYNRVLPPHGHHIHPKPKSSSAPLLSNSRLHNGDDPMDDLMEMDFSKPTKNAYVDMTAGSTNKSTPEGYVEMKPALRESLRIHENLRPHDESPYVDMQTGSSPPRMLANNDYTHMSVSSTDARSTNEEYVDMDPRKNNKHVLAQTDLRPSFSWSQSDYMEMNFQNKPRSFFSGSPKNLSGSPSSSSGLSMDVGFHICPHTRSDSKPSPMNTDGYVEMSLGKQNAHQRQSSLDSAKVTLDFGDYSDMSGSKKKEKRGSKKESKKSQPISIQPPNTSSQYQYPKNSSSISPVYSSLHIGRKHSTGTPPKMHLPLFSSSSGSYPSLPRRIKKSNHKDSRDSSSSSLTTPSSSSTIFPISLNSPSSPIKPYSSTRTPETQGIIKLPSAIKNIKYNPVSKGAFCSKDDYTIMDFEKCRANNSHSTESDYVNYNPAQNSKEKERPMSDNVSNYAIMKLGAPEISSQNDRKVVTKLSSPSSLTPQISSLDLSMSGNRCFRPITEPRDESNVESVSPKPGDVAPLKPPENMGILSSTTPRNSRPNSVIENDRTFSIIDDKSRPSSRPSSTSSETGSTTSTLVGSRPPSVSSSDQIRTSLDGQLHYATLDLVTAPEDESGCSSPRFLKNHAFSETSCGNVVADGSGFLYAEIDFVKSEGLKQNSLPTNAKVKH